MCSPFFESSAKSKTVVTAWRWSTAMFLQGLARPDVGFGDVTPILIGCLGWRRRGKLFSSFLNCIDWLPSSTHPPLNPPPLHSFLLTIYLSVKCFLANQVRNQRPLPLLCGQTGTCHVATIFSSQSAGRSKLILIGWLGWMTNEKWSYPLRNKAGSTNASCRRAFWNILDLWWPDEKQQILSCSLLTDEKTERVTGECWSCRTPNWWWSRPSPESRKKMKETVKKNKQGKSNQQLSFFYK